MRRTAGPEGEGEGVTATLAAGLGATSTQDDARAEVEDGDDMLETRQVGRRAVSHVDATQAADGSVGERAEDGEEAEYERGASIGRYVVLDRLGAGAMGVVYAAYDPELDRKVALKLVRAAVGAGTAASLGRTRLLREAQALAKLSHPHVVAIHDVGTVGERVWLAMEYVDGVTLGDWLEQRRRSWQEVLAMMRRVGEGLAAAHAVGLVHRDLKPDNAMVGNDGRVRVMDFGLARAAGNFEVEGGSGAVRSPMAHAVLTLSVTQVGAVMGTPAYMAPEQWRGELADARADQFAFCVTLWEAVYGARPFAGETMTNLAASVIAGELRAPPRGARVPGWVRRTLARGLQTEPERRFPSMAALLAELDAGERRQRRGRLAVVAGVVAAAIAAVPLSLQWQRSRTIAGCEAAGAEVEEVWGAEARSGLEQAMQASGVGYAATTFAKTTPWFDAWAAGWATTRAAVCVEAEVERTRSPELYAGAVACLEEKRDEFAALLGVLREGGAEVVAKAVTAAAGLAPASACGDNAALERRAPLPEDPEARAAVAELRGASLRAQGLSAAGRTKDGLTAAEELLTRAEAVGYEPLTVRIRLQVGVLAEKAGKLDEAERALVRAFVDAGAIGADEVAASAAIQLVYFSGHTRAKFEPAMQWSHAATLLVRRLGKMDDLLGARLDNALAVTLKGHGDFDAAQARYERLLATRERILGAEHPDVGLAMGNLANILGERGLERDADPLRRRSLAILETAYGPDHPAVAQSLNNLGSIRMREGHLDEAQRMHERALAIRETAYGPNHAEVALSVLNLALVAVGRGDLEEARVLNERGLAIREKVYGPDHPLVGEAISNMAAIRLRQKALDEAQQLAERALAIREKVRGPDHPEVAFTLYNLGEIQEARGDLAASQRYIERVVAIREKHLAADSGEVAGARAVLADLLVRRGDVAGARARVDQALAVAERGTNPDDPLLAGTLRIAGDVRRAQGELDAAQGLYERALAAHAARSGAKAKDSCEILEGLGRVALDRRRGAEAALLFERAAAVCEEEDEKKEALAGLELARRAAKKR